MSSVSTSAGAPLPAALSAGLAAGPVTRARPSVVRILRELWHARDLVVQFTRRDITVRYAQAVMGFVWALFMPLLVVGAGLLFRLVVSYASGSKAALSDVASLLVKALPWSFFSAALSAGTMSVLAQAGLIGKVKFPRESLPIAAVAAQGVDMLVGAVFVVIALPLLGVGASWAVLWAPAVLALLVAFTIGLSLLLSCANLFYRDVKYIVQIVLQFGVFGTPVFFAPELLPARARDVMFALPLTPFIQGLDVAVVRGHNLLRPLTVATPRGAVSVWSPWMLVYSVGLTALLLVVGLRVFRRSSARFAEMA